MPDVLIRHIDDDDDDIDPEVLAIARPIVAKWQAAIIRVAIAHAQPGVARLPTDPDSPERLLLKRFARQSPGRKDSSAKRAALALGAPAFSAGLSTFVKLDFDSPQSVNSLAKAAPVTKASPQRLQAMLDRRAQRLAELGVGRPDAAAPLGSRRRLQLQLQRVVCVDETDGIFGTEIGQDEIELGGVALDGDATTEIGKVGPFGLGNYDDGTRKEFQNKPLFDFTVAGPFPRAFYVTLVMVEADQGNFNDTMDAIIDKLAKEATDKLTALIGGAVGSALGPLGFLVGVVVGYVVGKVINFLIRVWEDDPFGPRTIEVIIPSADARIADPSRVVRFTGPGHFAVRYQWSLSAPSSGPVVGT